MPFYRFLVIKDAGLAAFGERWGTDAGYASLILDYRHQGESDGEPRNVVELGKQLDDYRSVIQWAREHPALFREDKIVVMGSAMSAIYVANLVLQDDLLAGGMVHCPLLDGKSFIPWFPCRHELADHMRDKQDTQWQCP